MKESERPQIDTLGALAHSGMLLPPGIIDQAINDAVAREGLSTTPIEPVQLRTVEETGGMPVAASMFIIGAMLVAIIAFLRKTLR